MASRPWSVYAVIVGAITTFAVAWAFGGPRDRGLLPMLAASALVVGLLLYGVWTRRTGAWLLSSTAAALLFIGALLSLLRDISPPAVIVAVGSVEALVMLNLRPTRDWVRADVTAP